jgi:hypothetical protein
MATIAANGNNCGTANCGTLQIVSIGERIGKLGCARFGIKKAAHGVEFAEVKYKNHHCLRLHRFGVGRM